MSDADPTAIDIEFDPTHQRFIGVAYHGDTPFDVPFISQIDGNLWQGGLDGDASRGIPATLVLPTEIEHVISLYRWDAYRLRHPLRSFMEIEMQDSANEPVEREQIVRIAEWVNYCRNDAPTLVHCQAGLNRSSLVAATALILGGRTPEEAVALLREKRSPAVLCNPLFEQWVLDFVADVG